MKTMSIVNQTNRVSKKFYAEIISRINETFGSVMNCPDLISVAVKVIDQYIADGTLPQGENILVTTAFLMIKSEIDKAAMRSRRARESANRRRKPSPEVVSPKQMSNPEMVQPKQISNDEKLDFTTETTQPNPQGIKRLNMDENFNQSATSTVSIKKLKLKMAKKYHATKKNRLSFYPKRL